VEKNFEKPKMVKQTTLTFIIW